MPCNWQSVAYPNLGHPIIQADNEIQGINGSSLCLGMCRSIVGVDSMSIQNRPTNY